MSEEQLVLAVKEHQCLYDKTSLVFKNWAQIGLEIGASGENCEKRWQGLRNRFSKEVKLEEKNASSIGPRWYLFEQMQFLRSHITPRRQRSNNSFEENLHAGASELNMDDFVAYSPLPSAYQKFPVSPTPTLSARRAKRVNILDEADEAIEEAALAIQVSASQKAPRAADPTAFHFGAMVGGMLSKMSEPKKTI